MNEAMTVLIRARDELILEIARCGQNGGTGRVQNYSPILNNIQRSIEVIESMEDAQDAEVAQHRADFGAKMVAARAAKKASRQSEQSA